MPAGVKDKQAASSISKSVACVTARMMYPPEAVLVRILRRPTPCQRDVVTASVASNRYPFSPCPLSARLAIEQPPFVMRCSSLISRSGSFARRPPGDSLCTTESISACEGLNFDTSGRCYQLFHCRKGEPERSTLPPQTTGPRIRIARTRLTHSPKANCTRVPNSSQSETNLHLQRV